MQMQITKYIYTNLLLFIVCSATIYVQRLTPIQTDRPGQTECPFIVPKNNFQVESGFSFKNVNENEEVLLSVSIMEIWC